MKKWISVLVLIVMSLLLVSCGKTGDCELCGKKDVSLEEVEVMGEKGYVCESCAEGFQELEDLADELEGLM